MNEIAIIGILSLIFVAMCIITGIVENKEAIFDWLYDVGTAVCKFRHRRSRRGW